MGDVTRVLSGLGDFEATGAVECTAGGLEVSVRVARPEAACRRCGTFSSRVKECRTQRARDGLSYERPTVLVWTERRFRCAAPGCVGSFTESAAQAPRRRRVTARLCVAMARTARDRSTAAAARTFQVSWSTARRAAAAAARRKIAALSQAPPRRSGIDETAFRRRRSFMTGLADLDTSRLWDLIEGRSKKALVGRLEELGEQVREIEAAVIDPYAGYKAAVRDLAPGAARVADRFHMQRLAAQALTEARRRRQTELTGRRGRKGGPLWAARRDLPRSRRHLTTSARERLDAAFRADCRDELERARTLKETPADLYASADRPAAEAAPADWRHHADASDVAETDRLARTLRAWQPELLAHSDDRDRKSVV